MKPALLLAGGLLLAAAAPPGASSCTGCHGGSTALPRLSGQDASEIIAAMDSFRAGTRPATLMTRIAKGFTPEETAAIAAWLASQP